MHTPPGPHPAIQPETPVRLGLRDLLMLGAVVISLTFAGAAWAITLRRDVSEVRAWSQRFDERLGGIEDALGIRHRSSFGPPSPAPSAP